MVSEFAKLFLLAKKQKQVLGAAYWNSYTNKVPPRQLLFDMFSGNRILTDAIVLCSAPAVAFLFVSLQVFPPAMMPISGRSARDRITTERVAVNWSSSTVHLVSSFRVGPVGVKCNWIPPMQTEACSLEDCLSEALRVETDLYTCGSCCGKRLLLDHT